VRSYSVSRFLDPLFRIHPYLFNCSSLTMNQSCETSRLRFSLSTRSWDGRRAREATCGDSDPLCITFRFHRTVELVVSCQSLFTLGFRRGVFFIAFSSSPFGLPSKSFFSSPLLRSPLDETGIDCFPLLFLARNRTRRGFPLYYFLPCPPLPFVLKSPSSKKPFFFSLCRKSLRSDPSSPWFTPPPTISSFPLFRNEVSPPRIFAHFDSPPFFLYFSDQ